MASDGGQRVVEARANSNANRLLPKCDVRFTPKSGHVRCNLRCLLWAKSGHRTDVYYGLRRTAEVENA
jgi:hypothetical protein